MQDEPSPADGGDVYGNVNALPKGTRLDEFEIERVLGEGGFAIVYLAFDHSLHRRVALKEYLPAEFAFRQDEHTIVLRSVQYQKTFEAGRKSFVQEARFLAQFEHPSLVKVHRVFESNGTAYMVQGYYAGESLAAIVKGGRRYTDESVLRPIVASLLAAVEILHARQCLHRDIAPDNIIVQPSGVPVLLDFGAARRIIGDMTQALTAVLKPSYAPIEQYTEDGGLAQGPWTDVYALAATLRAAITGKPPPSSVGRTIKDGLVKFADDPPPGFDLQFLRGIDAGLALLPADRPQSIADFRSALGLTEPDADATAPPVPEPPPTVMRPSAPPPPPAVAPAPVAPPVRAEPVATPKPSAPPPPPPKPAPAPHKRIRRNDVLLIVIGVAAVLLMLLVPLAADWIWPSPPTTPRVARVDRPAPPPAPSPAPVPAQPSAATPTPTPPPPVVAVAPAPAPKETKPAPVAPPPAAAAPEKAPVPVTPPPKAVAPAPEPAPPPRQEAPVKPPAPAPSASLIPAPSSQPAPAPAPNPPREEPPKPAAVSPPPQVAAIAPAPPPAPKARRSLVRVAGDPPVYPRDAIRSGIESGRVVALVTVDERGNVLEITIVTSEPARVFDRAARTALDAWKFKAEGERYQGEVELLFNLK